MKKISRFDALAKGLSFIKAPIKKQQVNNIIEKARLSSELALAECNANMEKAAAVLVENPSEKALTELSDLLVRRDELKQSMELAAAIKAYLEEEVEVDDEKKK